MGESGEVRGAGPVAESFAGRARAAQPIIAEPELLWQFDISVLDD